MCLIYMFIYIHPEEDRQVGRNIGGLENVVGNGFSSFPLKKTDMSVEI